MSSGMRLMTAFLAVASFLQPARTGAQFDANIGGYSSLPHLRAKTITGTVTRNGKPMDGTVLTLRKFLGAYSIEPARAGSHILGKAITTEDGRFYFDEVPSGEYVILVRGIMLLEVDLVKPTSGESDTLAIEKFAGPCPGAGATIISAQGRKLKDLSPLSTTGCY
jgi:hypothetical protein